MDHAVVQKWLRSVLGPYTDRDRVFADVDRALIAVSSLSPKTEVFTFNDGRTQLLVNLEGTIPVDFRGTTYNIPVAYWIPRDYPREPPMAFVAPTPDMAIRKGPNVDPSGEIGGDYLKRWRSKPEACNLLDLIHDCQHMFGREPPVYAKPKPTPVYATAASQQQRSQPSTPQRQASTSSNLAPAQRQGPPPPIPASPQSPYAAAGPSFNNLNDPRQKPPPPAPSPGTPTSPQGAGQHAPHRPPKPSSSLGPDGGHHAATSRPQSFVAPQGQFGWQSPQQTGTPRFASEEAYRRSSGAGLAPAAVGHPSQRGAPNTLQYAPQSPSVTPQSPSHIAQWQQATPDRVQDAQPHRHGSHQYLAQQQHQQYPQQHQHQQRAHTYPYPASEPHHGAQTYSGSPGPALEYASHQNGHSAFQPQHGQPGAVSSQSKPPPVPGANPYQQPASVSGSMSNGPANGYRETPPQPALAPKSKGVSLLDDEDAADAGSASSAVAAPQTGHPGAPPPPRPINPELLALHDRLYTKLDSRLSTLATTLTASNARLELLSSDLDRGLPAIEDEMSRLKAVRDVCLTTGDRLQTSVSEINESLRSLQAREDPDPDSMVLATSIVGNQLVDLVAEDNAIEDTLYHLGRALNAERLDLERFLKQTRMLAREQFMKRALAMKISEGMGWAE